ncbi:hypothetical protein V6N13_117363 [Hibiscus sabdariffa]|uniref:Uncharacterized protein n=1 Tax=Hibiscus sabdariffa TaxID=183260 RepID=A0ABR2PB26_9ROSI
MCRVDTSVPTEETGMHPEFYGENLEKNEIYNRLSSLATKHACMEWPKRCRQYPGIAKHAWKFADTPSEGSV